MRNQVSLDSMSDSSLSTFPCSLALIRHHFFYHQYILQSEDFLCSCRESLCVLCYISRVNAQGVLYSCCFPFSCAVQDLCQHARLQVSTPLDIMTDSVIVICFLSLMNTLLSGSYSAFVPLAS